MQTKYRSLDRNEYQSIAINIYLNTRSCSSRRTWINCICFNAQLSVQDSRNLHCPGLLLAESGVRKVTVEELAPPCGLWKMTITSQAKQEGASFTLVFSMDVCVVCGMKVGWIVGMSVKRKKQKKIVGTGRIKNLSIVKIYYLHHKGLRQLAHGLCWSRAVSKLV